MGLWSVLAAGQGFVCLEGPASFELYGVVSANDPNAAFSEAIDLAARHWPEISQGHQTSGAEAFIRAEEINEVALMQGMEVDVVDISWIWKQCPQTEADECLACTNTRSSIPDDLQQREGAL
ncbi:MAG TPA: hypothetical protein VFG49_17600 [Dyella sp.]|uniref:hypothetical protein n=1 Tax=Dyella sp. TaxID=1869338 RepID=UPI002D77DCE5|nr:hypothetical protein [Dyella sp.]HET6555346.1 hypothetical protein [Dyella sp.]